MTKIAGSGSGSISQRRGSGSGSTQKCHGSETLLSRNSVTDVYVFCVYSLPAYFNNDKKNKATLMDICSIDRYIFKNLKSLALFDFSNFSWRLCTCCTRRTTGSTSSQRTAGRDSYLTATPHSSAPRYSWLLFVNQCSKSRIVIYEFASSDRLVTNFLTPNSLRKNP